MLLFTDADEACIGHQGFEIAPGSLTRILHVGTYPWISALLYQRSAIKIPPCAYARDFRPSATVRLYVHVRFRHLQPASGFETIVQVPDVTRPPCTIDATSQTSRVDKVVVEACPVLLTQLERCI